MKVRGLTVFMTEERKKVTWLRKKKEICTLNKDTCQTII